MSKYGFIGGGNMGGAMALACKKAVGADNVLLVDRDKETTARLANSLGVTASSYDEIAKECRLIFVGVKPNLVAQVLQQLRPALQAREDDVAVVSIAAGVKIEDMCEVVGDNIPVIRMMQNTPVSLGEGMMIYALSGAADEDDVAELKIAMACAGRLDAIAEDKIDAATAVMGCGPAFAYQFVEALADGGVACGLTRAQAQLYAAQMLAGAAQMVLQTGKHPGELKDAVCSPGGSTIEGVRALEQAGFRSAVMDAVIASYEKNKLLGKK
jgi:pyrroline-5-carboxylate reductase